MANKTIDTVLKEYKNAGIDYDEAIIVTNSLDDYLYQEQVLTENNKHKFSAYNVFNSEPAYRGDSKKLFIYVE